MVLDIGTMVGKTRTRPIASDLNSLELFSGAGGLALATHRAGFKHILLLERDIDACKTLTSNIATKAEPGIGRWTVLQADVQRVSFGGYSDVDLIAGGAACQPFSIAGSHAGRKDPRNLLPEFIRSVREVGPKSFLLENVDGLLRPGFSQYFDYVIWQLRLPQVARRAGEKWTSHHARLVGLSGYRGLRYEVRHARLNAADFGVPQVRRRVFVVGIRSDVEQTFDFPIASHSLDRLLHDQWVSGIYWDRHELSKPGKAPKKWQARVDWLSGTKPRGAPWVTTWDAIGDLPVPGNTAPQRYPQHVFRSGARGYVGHSGSAEHWPSKTIKAGNHGVPGGENMLQYQGDDHRYYTVREMARIQTFPDQWTFMGTWKALTRQIGNAVPVALGQTVADAVANCLRW